MLSATTKRTEAKESRGASARPNELWIFVAFEGNKHPADERRANPKSVKLALSLQSNDSLLKTESMEKTMNADLKNFVEQMLRAILMTLVPVVATAFLTMPISLGGHHGEKPAQAAAQQHMT